MTYYAITLTRGGPRVPCAVWFAVPNDPVTGEPLDRAPRWQCLVRGIETDIADVMIEYDPATGVPVMGGEEIDEAEYRYMLSLREYAMAHDPTMHEAAPRMAINHLTGDTVF